ncbi:sensor histidine kinase [Streptomyces buecherae]|uniref:sensor histidine kinase n=1 Tax=Streptomyces buecherae TaxID=2763006 RepID=UPI0020B7426E|nr:histidine kinase [Streptomyces buecherae]
MTEFTAALREDRRPPARTRARPSAWDVALALAVLVVQSLLALSVRNDGSRPDALGWVLLIVSALALVPRRTAPTATTVVVVLAVGPYHSLDYAHFATVPAGLVALYALAVGAPARRSLVALSAIVGVMAVVMSNSPDDQALPEMMRSSGWLLAVVVIGIAVRTHRNYVAAIVERAERAERTREEEAARRVAEERLRIARDLHDLLAHSITLIGVQTSVAAHVLVADPDRLDRDAVAKALDSIADTCRDARAELRTTLRVLRAGEAEPAADSTRPPPGLAGLSDLASSAEAAGARVTLDFPLTPSAASTVPPAVGAAAYRIVQEALTNAVRHAGPDVRTVATVRKVPHPWAEGEALSVTVTDDGPPSARVPGQRRGGAPTDPAAPTRESAPSGLRTAGAVGAVGRPSAGGAALGHGASAGAGPGPGGGASAAGSGTGGQSAVSSGGPGGSGGPAGAGGAGAIGAEGFGIAGMRERARSVGGSVTAGWRADGPGFVVRAILPLASTPRGGPAAPRGEATAFGWKGTRSATMGGKAAAREEARPEAEPADGTPSRPESQPGPSPEPKSAPPPESKAARPPESRSALPLEPEAMRQAESEAVRHAEPQAGPRSSGVQAAARSEVSEISEIRRQTKKGDAS